MHAPQEVAPARFHKLITVGMCLIAVLAALASWKARLDWQQAAIWLFAVSCIVIGLRITGRPIVGPVLLYDMVRSARRPQLVTLRCLYAGLLLLTLFSVYCRWFQKETGSLLTPFISGAMDRARLAEFGESVFIAYLAVQFIAIFLLTPACTAGAIAEEKDRRGLDYLFATDLSSREIVLSIYLSRLGTLVLVLLTGLPMLGLVQLFGGVDPQLVLASFAASGMTLLSLGAWSVLCSVYTRKPRFAILLAGLGLFVYMLGSWCLWKWCIAPPTITGTVTGTIPTGTTSLLFTTAGWIVPPAPGPPTTLETIVTWINVGNPYTVWQDIQLGMAIGWGTLPELLGPALKSYACFHGLVVLICLSWAVLRLRPVALRQATRGSRTRAAWYEGWTGLPIGRPRVGNFPMLWKELHIEAAPLRMISVLLFLILLAYFCMLPVLMILYLSFYDTFDKLAAWIHPLFREASMVMACLMLLGVAVRAAGSVSGEQERGSLDGLLLAPQDSSTILFAKWLGSIFGVRWFAVWLGFFWLIGIATGSLSGDALPWLLAAWLFYAAFAASLGLWFSVVCQTSQRALMWTLIVGALLFGGHWLIWMLLVPVVGVATSFTLARELTDHLQTYGLTPPLTFRLLSSVVDDAAGLSPLTDELVSVSLLTGLALYGMGALLFWTLASKRFRRMTGRSSEAFSLGRAFESRGTQLRRPPVALNWPEESPL